MAEKDFFDDHSFFDGLKQGLEEALEYAKGDKTKGRSRIVSYVAPVAVSPYKSDDIARLRRNLNMSQRGLAAAIGVSSRTVEAWETGKSSPSGVATRMLYLIDNDNTLIQRLTK